jgi:hypothetical protein
MHNPGGLGSGNFLLPPFGAVGWCIVEMEVDTLKRLPIFVVAEIPFDIRQDRCAKEFLIVPHPGRQRKKTMDARRRPNSGNRTFLV